MFDNLWCPDSSSVQNFSIAAIESPNVSELAAPVGSYTLPFVITQGMTQSQLPVTMAGGKIGVTVDTIGPASMSLTATAAYWTKWHGQQRNGGDTPNGSDTEWVRQLQRAVAHGVLHAGRHWRGA